MFVVLTLLPPSVNVHAKPMSDRGSLYARVGKKIREVRAKRRITQEGLAGTIGLSRTSISNIEKGRQKILLHTLFDIAKALSTDPAEFIPRDQQQPEQGLNEMLPPDLSPQERKFIEAGLMGGKRRKRTHAD